MKQGFCIAAIVALVVGMGVASAQQNSQQTEKDTEAEIIADIAAGQKLYKRQCALCHGPTAKGMASYPKLVGHPVDYIVGRLEQYRAGERLGANTPLMAPRAKKLSDQHIADLAAFIGTLP